MINQVPTLSCEVSFSSLIGLRKIVREGAVKTNFCSSKYSLHRPNHQMFITINVKQSLANSKRIKRIRVEPLGLKVRLGLSTCGSAEVDISVNSRVRVIASGNDHVSVGLRVSVSDRVHCAAETAAR